MQRGLKPRKSCQTAVLRTTGEWWKNRQVDSSAPRRPGAPSPRDHPTPLEFRAPVPATGTIDESPFVTLMWDRLDPSAGAIHYQVYVSIDSEQVASYTVPPLARPSQSYYLPRASWQKGTTYFWSVIAFNHSTDEQLASPVWRFQILPEDTPIDSVTVLPSQWGFYNPLRMTNDCMNDRVVCAPDRNAAIGWNFGSLGSGFRLAGVKLRMSSVLVDGSTVSPTVWSASGPWSACAISNPAPPSPGPDGMLASGVAPDRYQLEFSSDALTAHVEASIRGTGFYGYLLRSGSPITYITTPGAASLRLYYYREPQTSSNLRVADADEGSR